MAKSEDDKTGEKIETCYFCLQKFDMNKSKIGYYHYGKFPVCDHCSEFYGFYNREGKL